MMETADVWPEDEEHRYRLYLVMGEEARIVAAAGSLEGLGIAFGQVLGEGEVEVDERVGVMDTGAGEDAPHRRWLVNPYA